MPCWSFLSALSGPGTMMSMEPVFPDVSHRQDPPRSNGASWHHRMSYLERLRHAEDRKKDRPKSGPVFGYVNCVELLPQGQARKDFGNQGRRKISARVDATEIDRPASNAAGVCVAN